MLHFKIFIDVYADALNMVTIEDETSIGDKYFVLQKVLGERARRLWAATEAKTFGFGGVSLVANQTGLARSTIYRGLDELKQIEADCYADIAELGCDRRPGAGRKSIVEVYPGISEALESLIEPVRGDPESSLRWTCKSTRRLAEELPKHQKVSSICSASYISRYQEKGAIGRFQQ